MSTATTAVEVVSPSHFALALNQLSEEDRLTVLRLKQTYPAHILEPIFVNSRHSDTIQWRTCSSPNRRSSAASTLWLSPSNDAESNYGNKDTKPRPDPSILRRVAALSRPISRGRSKSNQPKPKVDVFVEEEEISPKDTSKMQPPGDVKTLYFCTSCDESFGEKSDWKEHEYLLHDRQYYWPCPYPGCDQVFNKDTLFKQHHVDVHGCKECDHAYEVQRPLPSKRSWACGFDQCKAVFDNWNKRCNHVLDHFDKLASQDDTSSEPSQWKYTNMIRNLLRQPDIRDAYRRFMERCHGDDKFMWPKMEWQASNSKELRRKLEYRDFREGVQEIARLAYQLGHPTNHEAMKIMNEPDEPETPEAPSAPHIPEAIIITSDSDDTEAHEALETICPPPSPSFVSRIDKFPQPGSNPFDLYGPVPPSPIIQLDFVEDIGEQDISVNHIHSSKSSISLTPYSLYPSAAVARTAFLPATSPNSTGPTPPASKSPSILNSPELMHPFNSGLPSDPISLQAPATWATAYATVDNSPPRPKTPMGMLRSAKSSIMRKKSAGQMRGGIPVYDGLEAGMMAKALPPLPVAR